MITPVIDNHVAYAAQKEDKKQQVKGNTAVKVIASENGDFENPLITNSRLWDLFDDSQVPGWKTTATDHQIELEKNGVKPDKKQFYAQSGEQWAELNAVEESALYQDIPTTPGIKVRWQVYHMGRLGTDTAVVEFGAPGKTMVQQAEMIDGNTEWGLYKGEYTIPKGQTMTRFQFRSISATGGDKARGNYLDNIQFATQPVLDVRGTFNEPSVKVKNNANYTIQAKNVGGMPAANNTFSVKIPAELNYTPGSLFSTNTTISNEQYDAVTRTLTFTTGTIKKDATVAIQIPLTGVQITPAATPDTTVTYNDENFNKDRYTVEGMDSSIEVKSNEMPTISGEKETVLQPNATFDPMGTMGAQDKEDGNLTTQIKVIQ